MKQKTAGIISLGCARNTVDSQEILARLQQQGYKIVDGKNAEIVILNSCAFIEDAKKESLDTLFELIDLKKQGKIKKVILAGCLPQRYGQEIVSELREVDAFWGVQAFEQEKYPTQVALTPPHFAYVKICESCFNHCGFCVIPKIKGKFISRTQEAVLAEIRRLDAAGVREIILIGQDITAYGLDIYKEKKLPSLLSAITKNLKNIRWVRLLYTYPAHFSEELLEVMAREERICKYIDIPLQHISDHLLRAMKRPFYQAQIKFLIRQMQERIPVACLRTTFIVGLPGETEKDFQELMGFVRETRFNKVGVFKYSREEGTAAYAMPQQVSARVKEQRYHALMQEQQGISMALQERFVGQTLKVLVDEKVKSVDNMYYARTEFDAPEVDGVVAVHASRELAVGQFVDVRITDSSEYDLAGEALT